MRFRLRTSITARRLRSGGRPAGSWLPGRKNLAVKLLLARKAAISPACAPGAGPTFLGLLEACRPLSTFAALLRCF